MRAGCSTEVASKQVPEHVLHIPAPPPPRLPHMMHEGDRTEESPFPEEQTPPSLGTGSFCKARRNPVWCSSDLTGSAKSPQALLHLVL